MFSILDKNDLSSFFRRKCSGNANIEELDIFDFDIEELDIFDFDIEEFSSIKGNHKR
jgi:hypothetical protein